MVMISQIGTPAFMDNRVAEGKPYDLSVDIFAMGMIFLSIFKGKGIFEQCSSKSEMMKKRSDLISNFDQSMDTILSGIPDLLKDIIKNCLH